MGPIPISLTLSSTCFNWGNFQYELEDFIFLIIWNVSLEDFEGLGHGVEGLRGGVEGLGGGVEGLGCRKLEARLFLVTERQCCFANYRSKG